MPAEEKTLQTLLSRTKLVGDLPIFSASINRVRRISADPDSDAMALAKEIMKDANFSIKVLRLANSPFYNRGRGKIGVISRAVVVLGFDTLKNISLTLKMIESFQHEHPSIDMNTMLVRSYLSAGFVHMLALKCGIKDVEESYTCALLHRLGEVALAYFMPERYAQIQSPQKTAADTPVNIQHNVMDTTFAALGQGLAAAWEFPSTVVQSMGHYDAQVDGPARGKTQFNRAIASLANTIVGTVYHLDRGRGPAPLDKLFDDLAAVTGLEVSGLQNCLTESFKQSCSLAEEYGLSKTKLMPLVDETGDTLCDTLARQFAYYASSRPMTPCDEPSTECASAGEVRPLQGAADLPQEIIRAAPAPVTAWASDTHLQRQLMLLQEITTLITETASLNVIFGKIIEGLHQGVGFDHALLCLVNRDRTAYSARAVLGSKSEQLSQYFQHPIDTQRDLFSKVLMDGNDLLVENAADTCWANMLREDFPSRVEATGFAVAPVRIECRPVGFFYVDKSLSKMSITEAEYRGFIQFISQAKLAVTMSTRNRIV